MTYIIMLYFMTYIIMLYFKSLIKAYKVSKPGITVSL